LAGCTTGAGAGGAGAFGQQEAAKSEAAAAMMASLMYFISSWWFGLGGIPTWNVAEIYGLFIDAQAEISEFVIFSTGLAFSNRRGGTTVSFCRCRCAEE
jgi:hypothetical protein